MSVYLYYMPAEASHLSFTGSRFFDVAGPTVYLLFVEVYDGAEVVNLIVRGGHGGFPYLPFVKLAVPNRQYTL